MTVVTAVTDPKNVEFYQVKEDPDARDVANGYALLAGAQRPPVLRGSQVENDEGAAK